MVKKDETLESGSMKTDCPVCGGKGTANYTTITHKIAYFGEVMESTIECEKCGFKHNDIMALEQKEPAKHSLMISGKNLSSRVVRSQTATVSLPEIGIKVEPGPKSEGYVSNIEGVITRFIDATLKALKLFTDDESQKNANALLIEDPFGQSQIMDVNAKTEPLTQEELKHLRTGFVIIDDDDEDLDEMEDE